MYGFSNGDGLFALFEEGGYSGEEGLEGGGWELRGHSAEFGWEKLMFQKR